MIWSEDLTYIRPEFMPCVCVLGTCVCVRGSHWGSHSGRLFVSIVPCKCRARNILPHAHKTIIAHPVQVCGGKPSRCLSLVEWVSE